MNADQEHIILDSIDKFLAKDVAPVARDLEQADAYPHEIVEKMRNLGLFGATIGESYGGLGLPASTYAKIVERVSAVWMSVSGIFNSHLIMCAAIERFATESMKETYLPRFASGEVMGAMGIERVDEDELVTLCKSLLAQNPKAVEDLKAGKMKAVGALIGQAKKQNPNVNPSRVREICIELVEHLDK